MSERPILFSAPMVLALLAGTKTQTRRVVKFGRDYASKPPTLEEARARYAAGFTLEAGFFGVRCPYGKPGDRLWVRETWKVSSESNHYPTDEKRLYVEYRAGAVPGWGQQQSKFSIEHDADLARAAWGKGKSTSWRPSIHMPRWASRMSLDVKGVRVERLQEISEADAIAEGIVQLSSGFWGLSGSGLGSQSAREAYRRLWESINGAGSWAKNPWVWVVELKP